MVYIDEVAVQLDVQVARGLDGGVGYGRWCGVCDAREDCTRGKVDEGDGARGKGAGVVLYAEETGEVGLDPCGDLGGGRRRRGDDGLGR